MIRPIPFGRMLGVPVAVDWSWAVISVLMAGAFYVRVAPDQGSAVPAIGLAAAAALLLVASVLIHELSHAVVARRRGITVRSVTLFVFGGFTEMDTEPGSPFDEFAVAGSGPAASLVLGGVLWLGALPWSGSVEAILVLLATINVAVALFNLLPGLPLDGGRMLRALVWRATGDGDRAVRVAADAGRLIGTLIGGVGLALLVGRGISLTAALLLIVGWFLHRLATFSRRTSGRLGTPVADVMLPAPPAVAAHADSATVDVGRVPVPVVADRRVVGLVAGPGVPGRSAAAAMVPLRPGDLVDDAIPVGAVAGRLRRRRRPLVVVSEGRMVGLLPPGRVDAWLAESVAAGDSGGPVE